MAQKQNVGPPENQLSADIVRNLLKYGVYEAHLPNGARDRSRAYQVIRKIYEKGTSKEVKYWFQCSWCLAIWKTVNRRGTTPLIRHMTSCPQRLDEFDEQEDFATEENVAFGQNRQIQQNLDAVPIGQKNAFNGNEQENVDVLVENIKNVQIGRTGQRQVLNNACLTLSQIAASLARSSMIGWQFGPVHADDFEDIVPQPGEPW